MSTDIHFRLEKKLKSDKKWKAADCYNRVNSDYRMFAALADVCNEWNLEHLEIKGFPKDACIDTLKAYAIKVDEIDQYDAYGYPITISEPSAAEAVDDGDSEYITLDNSLYVSNPNWHTPNWCTIDEYKKALSIVQEKFDITGRYYREILNFMKEAAKDGSDVRLIFWFDC